MSDTVYTLAEEMVIGAVITLEPDFAVCDAVGCDQTASLLIPGGAFCRTCWEEHLDDDQRYYFPADDLVGDHRWREARTAEYEERIALMSPRRRNPLCDQILSEQVERRVELLLEHGLDPS